MTHRLRDSARNVFHIVKAQRMSQLSTRIGVAVVIASAALADAVVGQTTTVVDASQLSCKGCTLTLTKIATLGSINDGEFAGTAAISSGLAVDSNGRFFATSLAGDKILVYEPSGKYSRSFGRQGGGPGELNRAMKVVVGRGDSIHVLDQTRITTFSPTFQYVRSVNTSGPLWGTPVALANGDFVVSRPSFGPATAGFVRFPAKGEAIPFGNRTPEVRKKCAGCDLYETAPSLRVNQFWAIPVDAYEVQEWGADMRPARRLTIAHSNWFTEWTSNAMGPDVRPNPRLERVFEDARGQLWIEGHSSIANWTLVPRKQNPSASKDRGGANIPIGGGAGPNPEALKRTITIIEVLDVAGSKLVLSQQYAGRTLRMISPDLIAELREDADGIPVWDVFKVAIKKP
ncbi:MAG: hypothetical protein ABJB74_19070 [Gemmatimonas sp.]